MRELKRELWPGKVTVVVNDTRAVEDGYRQDPIWDWLDDNVGKNNWNRVYANGGKFDFYFKSESDATLFALRWGHVQG